MTAEPVLLSSGDEVRLLTLNRPDRLNALNRELWTALLSELERAATDLTVKVVVLTGAGRALTAGQDLQEMAEMVDDGEGNLPARMVDLLADFPVPLIVAVNGVAAGFGLGLVVHSDVCVMAAGSRLGAPFVSIGLGPDAGMSALLPDRIGPSRAARLLLTGGWMSADEAVAAGLACCVVSSEDLVPVALAEAERMARHSAEALRATKELLVAARRDRVRAALSREETALHRLAAGPAHRAAIESFLGGAGSGENAR